MTQSTRVSLLQQLHSNQNSGAWSKFVLLYTPLIYQWVSSLGLQDTDRNDVVQDVFIILLKRISSFKYDAQGSFRGWLRTITINKSKDLLRRKNRLGEPELRQQIDVAENSETDLLTLQEYRQIIAQSAMRMLQSHFSQTTWLACWQHVAEGKPAREVAENLGISVNAVYLARGRVLQRLRKELEGLWD